jgi:hypothetical protein
MVDTKWTVRNDFAGNLGVQCFSPWFSTMPSCICCCNVFQGTIVAQLASSSFPIVAQQSVPTLKYYFTTIDSLYSLRLTGTVIASTSEV